ncbi:MAG: hypothetical protein O7J95_07400, partial [Planctomycetota bacterium]|nr:hypothetical protein [Planctomycetota bacterium]
MVSKRRKREITLPETEDGGAPDDTRRVVDLEGLPPLVGDGVSGIELDDRRRLKDVGIEDDVVAETLTLLIGVDDERDADVAARRGRPPDQTESGVELTERANVADPPLLDVQDQCKTAHEAQRVHCRAHGILKIHLNPRSAA